MTNDELIKTLLQHPSGTPVVISQHSEYRDLVAGDISTVLVFDNGGYVSRIYREEDRPKGHIAILIL